MKSNIPGLIILPTVVGDVQSIALVGSSHFRKSVRVNEGDEVQRSFILTTSSAR
jgi:hypothetical protein